jgi:hypothetical protein
MNAEQLFRMMRVCQAVNPSNAAWDGVTIDPITA